MKRTFCSVVAIGLLISVCMLMAGCLGSEKTEVINAPAKGDPVGSAEAWLAVVDQGKYAESWQDTCEYFRGLVSQDQLVQQLSAVRKPMGEMVSRKMESATPKTAMPGAPDGKYVVIIFNTEFTNKKNGIETLTVMKDDDWKVAGYYIK